MYFRIYRIVIVLCGSGTQGFYKKSATFMHVENLDKPPGFGKLLSYFSMLAIFVGLRTFPRQAGITDF